MQREAEDEPNDGRRVQKKRAAAPSRTEEDEEYDDTTIQKRNAEFGRRGRLPSNVNGLNTDAGIEISGARKTLTKRYVAY
jgi:hypothetical protein